MRHNIPQETCGSVTEGDLEHTFVREHSSPKHSMTMEDNHEDADHSMMMDFDISSVESSITTEDQTNHTDHSMTSEEHAEDLESPPDDTDPCEEIIFLPCDDESSMTMTEDHPEDIESPPEDIESNSEDVESSPEDADPCCEIVCMPCDDEWMIRSQLLPMVALLLSWVWWVTLVNSLVGLAMFQVAWAYRESKIAIYICVLVAGICSMSSLCVWMKFTGAWFSERYYYTPFFLEEKEYDQDCFQQQREQDCFQLVWAIIAYICGTLWGATSYCVFYFVNRRSTPGLRRPSLRRE